jgi:hypothetical protein
MISKKNKEKVQKFYQVISKVQLPEGKEIGLIVVKRENMDDIINCAPNTNLVTSIELTKDADSTEIIKEMADSLTNKKTVIIRMHDWLDPKIYNQLFLLSKEGRMQYADLEDWKVIDCPREGNVIIISTDKEIESLNYKNLFDVVGPVARL